MITKKAKEKEAVWGKQMYKERKQESKNPAFKILASKMPGKDSASAKLTDSGQSPFPHMESIETVSQKIHAGGKGEGWGRRRQKQASEDTECVSVSRKFSQMIFSRLTHFVILSLAGEEGGNPALFQSPDYTPLSPHSLRGKMSSWEQEVPGCCLPLARPGGNLQVCCFTPRHELLGMPGYSPASCLLQSLKDGPASQPATSQHQPLKKSHRHRHIFIKIKPGNCLLQKREWSCLLNENWIMSGGERCSEEKKS